jgi:hypothetical protein
MNTSFIILILNCILIQYDIRNDFLIKNHDIIESKLYTISKTYPDLHQFKTNQGILISKQKPTNYIDNSIDISKKDYYVYHIKVNLTKKIKITLFSLVDKNLSSENEIYELLTHIKEILYDSEYSIYIKKIYIERLKKRNSKIIELKFIY